MESVHFLNCREISRGDKLLITSGATGGKFLKAKLKRVGK